MNESTDLAISENGSNWSVDLEECPILNSVLQESTFAGQDQTVDTTNTSPEPERGNALDSADSHPIPAIPAFLEALLTTGLTQTTRRYFTVGLRNKNNVKVKYMEVMWNEHMSMYMIHCAINSITANSLQECWSKFYHMFRTAKPCEHCKKVHSGEHHWGGVNNQTCETCQIRFAFQDKEECSVCTKLTAELYRLDRCDHAICRTCAQRWKRRTCPTCRKHFLLVEGWVEPTHDCDCDEEEMDEEDLDDMH
jgi:hypothetical protein